MCSPSHSFHEFYYEGKLILLKPFSASNETLILRVIIKMCVLIPDILLIFFYIVFLNHFRVCVCMCVKMNFPVPVYVEVRGQCQMPSSLTFYLTLWNRFSHWTLSWWFRQDWLTNKYCRSVFLCLSHAGVMPYTATLGLDFVVVSPNSGPCASKNCTLPTEPLSQPVMHLQCFFLTL